MSRVLLFIFLCIGMIVSHSLKAQVYNSAVGIVGGNSISGITYKKFIDSGDSSKVFKSWELRAGYKFEVYLNTLDIIHSYGVDGFFTYNTVMSPYFLFHYGYGAGVAIADSIYYTTSTQMGGLTTGALGIVGFEYVVKAAPIAFSFSVIPRVNVLYLGKAALAVQFLSGSLGIKYIIN